MTLKDFVLQLIDEGFIDTTEDGRLIVNGQLVGSDGDMEVEVSGRFDNAGFSTPDQNGARMLRGIEKYRTELVGRHLRKLAKELPSRYITPPANMDDATDTEAWKDRYPDWDIERLATAVENVRRTSIPGHPRMMRRAAVIGRKTSRIGRRYWGTVGGMIPNTWACSIGFAVDAETEAQLHDLVVEEIKKQWESKARPSPWG